METEGTIKPYELIHFGNYDVVINTVASDRDRLSEARNTVLNTFDCGTWRRLDGPRLFYKERRIGREPKLLDKIAMFHTKERTKSLDPQTQAEDLSPREKYSRSNVYTLDSLLNEFKLSPKIKRIIGSIEVQNVVKKHGFERLLFAEPLVGIIERDTGRKGIVYGYVAGLTGIHSLKMSIQSNDLFDQRTSLVSDLINIFTLHGVTPFDLHTDQFISQGTSLWLIDIEGYRKMRSGDEMMPRY